jgi:hypothetical protein
MGSQGPDAVISFLLHAGWHADQFQVHIQQVGQRELKRAPGLVKKAGELAKREDALFAKAGIKKAHL